MASRLLALTLAIFFAAAVCAAGSAYAQGDDLWYPGEGVQKGMFVKYRIQEVDTNGQQPFDMTMYFQNQTSQGDWIVPTFVVAQGRVIEGTLKLSPSMTYISGGGEVPPEMNDFVGGYSGSLDWLDSFTTKGEPKSLSAATWGRAASPVGSDVAPAGQETIRVPAGTFDTTRVALAQENSSIWVRDEFPFPVKAELADSTTGQPQSQFAFELLAAGTGEPDPPATGQDVPTPPLEASTDAGDYSVRLDWEPSPIAPGETVLFTVSLEKAGFPLEQANYDFTIRNSTGSVVAAFRNQNADAQLGTGTHEVKFDGAGGMTATVTINSAGGQAGELPQNVDFKLAVVPEFPLGAALIAASALGLAIAILRLRGSALPSLFGR